MRKLMIAGVALMTLASCTTTTTLYGWNDYVNSSYQYYKKQTPESGERLMKTYEAMIQKPSGSRKTIAPGICAEYGYFLIQNGKRDAGVNMLKKEKELYPESTVFMDRLIKQFAE